MQRTRWWIKPRDDPRSNSREDGWKPGLEGCCRNIALLTTDASSHSTAHTNNWMARRKS